MVATVRCEEIANEKYMRLASNEVYDHVFYLPRFCLNKCFICLVVLSYHNTELARTRKGNSSGSSIRFGGKAQLNVGNLSL